MCECNSVTGAGVQCGECSYKTFLVTLPPPVGRSPAGTPLAQWLASGGW